LNFIVVDPIVVKTVSKTNVSVEKSKFPSPKEFFFLQDVKLVEILMAKTMKRKNGTNLMKQK
jgi:hypothetical protein